MERRSVRVRNLSSWLAAPVLLAACGGAGAAQEGADTGPSAGDADVVAPRDAGRSPDSGSATDAAATDPPAGPGCADGDHFIHAVDQDGHLLRFDPVTTRFAAVGTIDCPSLGGLPFSMAVDREGRPWLLHTNATMFVVSTEDLSCEPAPFEPTSTFSLFGMGFVHDGSATGERLYVAGNENHLSPDVGALLGRVDPPSERATTVGGPLAGWPELAGTGDGQLWGFFPDTDPSMLQRLATDDGRGLETLPLPEVDASGLRSWALAFWGGRFYLFLHAGEATSSAVLEVDPETGDTRTTLRETGYRIVGAASSTCAPVDLI